MISTPYIYSDDEQIITDAFNNLPEDQKNYHYWSSDEINSIRGNLKRHYILQQNYRCCYCNRENRTTHGLVWQVEHVVAKSTHVRFMFEVKNLSTVCPDCNKAKDDISVLKNPNVVGYPNSGDRFKIVHPHFHNYSEHIRQIGNIYWGKTDEGKFTVRECDLLRFAAQQGGVPEHIVDSDIHEMLEKVFTSDLQSAQTAIVNAAILIAAKNDNGN